MWNWAKILKRLLPGMFWQGLARICGKAAAALYARAGNIEKAIDVSRKLLGNAPHDTKARIKLVRLYMTNGRLEEARYEICAIRSREKEYLCIVHDLALLFLQRGDAMSACALLEHIVSLNSTDATVYVNYGVSLYRLGRSQEAKAAYETALRLDEACEGTRYNRAFVYWDEADYAGALADFAHVLEVYEADVRVVWNCGELSLRLDKLNDAEKYFKQVTQLTPNNADGYCALGRTHIGQQRYEEALQALKKAADLAPDSLDCFEWLGVAYLRCEQYDKAQSILKRVVTEKPSLNSLLGLGEAYMEAKRPEDALPCFRHGLEMDPAAADAMYWLGVASLQLGDISGALAQYYALRCCDQDWAASLRTEINEACGNQDPD